MNTGPATKWNSLDHVGSPKTVKRENKSRVPITIKTLWADFVLHNFCGYQVGREICSTPGLAYPVDRHRPAGIFPELLLTVLATVR
jgi:hypothetical protein